MTISFDQFCARCDANGIQKPSSKMFTRWVNGNVKKSLKGLTLEQICEKHVQFHLGGQPEFVEQ